MKTKRGISLVTLAITILVMTLLLGITILQIDDVIEEVKKDDFVVELATIKDKVKEYYLLMGSLPVQGGTEYTADELKANISDTSYQTLLMNEITSNKDTDNTFLVVNLALLQIETNGRGVSKEATDIYVVATNTLNIYYLSGVEIDGVMRFSTVTLTDNNVVEDNTEQSGTQVSLNADLDLVKSTNVWTNEISITVKNSLGDNETLTYSIGDAAARAVPENNVILINSLNMTDDEKTLFATNKQVTINRLQDGSIVETKQISIDNLDITNPEVGTMQYTDTSNEDYNIVTISWSDQGGSGVKALYYDYGTVVVSGSIKSYYTDRSSVTANDLLNFGKVTVSGTINLAKNIKSIIVMAVDNAGNTSEITTYTIDDTYLTGE